ncbi:hypothetical protein DPX16_20789 [Anabarilius grahami]|uniref:LINE-1 type transposase domain-containing protein 1 n=1 Tax=Anabarilius grahami TaxID=495550 RepID=A0A3N0ZAK0_ANAGA|nr:hypothetical protein DPX16_20789 [Anabarilius grahami]
MPKSKRASPAPDETDEAGNMAVAASGLTPALLKEMLTTTIREETASLRTEFLTEIRASSAALQATISSHGSNIKDIEASMNSVDERLDILECKRQYLERDNEELKKLFGDKRPQTPEIERAHRSLAPKPRSGAPPRPMIVRFPHFQTREEILRLSLEHGELRYKESKILIFPDFSVELKKRRDQFKSVKAELQSVKFRMLYPCRLLSFNGESHSFDSPDAVSTFIATVVKPKQSSEVAAVDTVK